METTTIDRRIQRTNKKLRLGLASLLESCSLEDISVRQLCDASGVNRGTFYLHYTGISDMFEQFQNELQQRLICIFERYSAFMLYTNPGPMLTELLRFLKQNEDCTRLLFSPAKGYITLQRTSEALAQYLFEKSIRKNETRPRKDKYYFTYVLSGVFGVLMQWFRNGMCDNSADLVQLLTNVWTNGRKAFR